ncbi:MAG: TolC family protein [Flavobacteriales bacterium]|tara:strand:- start:2655 stop:3968 length:1314 start_codon:yes stop_codon:yes gene_type:complete
MKKIFSIFIFFPLIIFSQDSLSLSKAIEIGLEKNYDIRLTLKNVEIKRVFNSWGEAGRLPQININAGQNNSISDQRNNPISFAPFLFLSNDVSGGLAMNWTLFNGFAVKANKTKLEQLELQSENTATLAIENTIHGIILAYYQAKMQKEQLSLLSNIMTLTKEKYNQQQVKSDLGIGVKFDLLQFEGNLYTDSSNKILQNLAQRNAVRNLNLIMGEEVNKEWILSSEIKPDLNIKQLESLKKEMISNNTNIKNQYINIALTQQDISLAKSQFYPVVSFNSGFNSSVGVLNTNDVNSPISNAQSKNLNYYGNFTLNFKLYDGGKVKRGIKALELQNEVDQLRTSQMIDQLNYELTNVYELYLTRLQIFELTKKAFFVSKDNLDIGKLKEQSGLINSFNFRDIQMAYLASGVSLYQASYDLLESNATLLKMTGKIIQNN